MKPKKIVYYISKFTLIDELLGLVYGALAIYGIIKISMEINNEVVMIAVLCVYIISVVVIYMILVKKIKKFFTDES